MYNSISDYPVQSPTVLTYINQEREQMQQYLSELNLGTGGHHPHPVANIKQVFSHQNAQGGPDTSMNPNAQKKPCSDCKTPEQVAHCIKYGSCVSYQNGGGGSGSGSGGGGNGPPSWFKKWAQGQKGHGGGNQSGGGGGGGGQRLQGPSAIPSLNLPPVPAGSSTGPSPFAIMAVVALIGVGAYLIYHKLHKAKAEEHDLASKGE